jgi:hypothetical protein
MIGQGSFFAFFFGAALRFGDVRCVTFAFRALGVVFRVAIIASGSGGGGQALG